MSAILPMFTSLTASRTAGPIADLEACRPGPRGINMDMSVRHSGSLPGCDDGLYGRPPVAGHALPPPAASAPDRRVYHAAAHSLPQPRAAPQPSYAWRWPGTVAGPPPPQILHGAPHVKPAPSGPVSFCLGADKQAQTVVSPLRASAAGADGNPSSRDYTAGQAKEVPCASPVWAAGPGRVSQSSCGEVTVGCELTSQQRATHQELVDDGEFDGRKRRKPRAAGSMYDGEKGSGTDYDDENESAWGRAIRWAQAAGNELMSTERALWRRWTES